MNDATLRHFSKELTDYQDVADATDGGDLREQLPKPWQELAKLSGSDRIEMTQLFWKQKLGEELSFFERISDIRPFLVKEEGEWRPLLVYSFLDEPVFLFGEPPADEIEIAKLGEMVDCTLPADYVAFLQIHSGFGKNGHAEVLAVRDLRPACQVLDVALRTKDPEILYRSEAIDPGDLVPFFKAHLRDDYQCFFRRWLHNGQFGNVVCSLSEGYLSDPKGKEMLESGAFATFTMWLKHYVEEG